MAEIVGLNGLHNLEGFKCDLCSLPCDPQAQELNALDCTFSNCPSDASVYHQDCLEKYLKSIKLEKNRKTGFKCPRGCGKGSRFDQPCPGKITKSHPIHIRNDQSKKRQKALPPPPLEYKPKAKEKNKDTGPAEKGKDSGKNKDSGVDKGKAKAVAAVPAKERQVVPIHNPKPPVPNKHVEKQQIESIRREIAAKCGKATGVVPQSKPVPAKEKDFQTLHEYEAHKEASQPKANAWGARNNAARVLNIPVQQPQLQPPPPPPPPPKPVQAALPVASSWALAARQPPPPAVVAKPKAAAANGPVRAVSIWSTQQEHADAQPPPPPPKPSVTLVGGELAEPEVPVKVGKAAKKNMKRLEKRAKERAATDTSVASSDIVSDMYPETISEADNEGDTPSEARAGEDVSSLLHSDSREDGNGESYSGSDGLEAQTGDHPRCIQALMATKARWLLGQLQLLGFPDWQCAVAVLRYGSDLHGAIAFLLEDHVTSEEQSRAYMASAVDSPDIDITEEMQMLAEAQSCLGLPMSVVEKAVADADGDIQAGVNALLSQSEGSNPDQLHASHSEGPPQLQTHPPVAASQADMKQRRFSADISRPSAPSTASPSGPTKMATPWGSQGSRAQPQLSNGHHAGLDPWLTHQQQQQEKQQQQKQQQHEQQHVLGPPAMTFEAWHKDPATPSPFAAAAAQPPPPPPPKQAPVPQLPRPVELPATLEPQLQLGLGEFLPAGSAGLLSAKLGQNYAGTNSSGFPQSSQQQALQQQPLEQECVPYGSRLSSYTSAASRTATPKAADCSSWNGSLDSSASNAAAQGMGQAIPSLSSFSMFSAPSAAAAGRAADPWGSSAGSNQMANLERYNQLLQQSPGDGSGRSSFDSSHAPLPGSSAAAQRQAYLPSLSPGSSVSQASFSGYNMTQQPQASWGMLPLHSSAQSIWSSTPADRLGAGAPEAALLAAAAVAVDEPRRGDASGRDTSDADLELDSLMATLMCT
ncbi:hypothetical protein COCOBI_10-5730 [Coccomyxa sp. Obi]|nr:hypothetical protein COCOBI_10-5730 [Coccomyxa sp. Obi]